MVMRSGTVGKTSAGASPDQHYQFGDRFSGPAQREASAVSGYVCPGDDVAESFVVSVVGAPDDGPALARMWLGLRRS
jgi:hypothetical protein